MFDDFDRCYRAVQSKDARFDGWFVTAVLTTKIYCRPSCPVRPPHAKNMRFYPTSAAAQRAGFRACKRCRPDASPGSPEWNVRADVVARAMRLISDGVVDREGVGGLARHLGYSTRQVERHLTSEVGAGPLALARAQRAQTARILIETTALPMAHVAFAAGFASIRQFNDTVRLVFALSPTDLRRRARSAPAAATAGALVLRLPFRAPFVAESLFGHLVMTGVPGVEELRAGAYRRTLRLPNGSGVVSLTPQPDHVACRLLLDDLRDLTTALARCRRLLDLDADPEAVAAALGEDDVLAEFVAKAPGRRVPRTVDANELAVRVVLGQQISTAAARTHAARLVEALGDPVDDTEGGLKHLFPSAERLLEIDPAHLRLPAARRRCLLALVAAIAERRVELDAGADWDRARSAMSALPGLGEWSIEMIALRGLGDPDAFPAGDIGALRASAAMGAGHSAGALRAHAERWRPWRGYAVQYLWATHPTFSSRSATLSDTEREQNPKASTTR